MRKVMSGLRYDTEKSKLIGNYETLGMAKDDPRWWTASLYKTPRSGKFFLAGKGGGMTRFALKAVDFFSHAEDIIPLTDREALHWCEYFLTLEVIEKFFSNIIIDA